MNAHLTSSTKFQKRLDYVGQHALSASLCLMHDVMSLLTRFLTHATGSLEVVQAEHALV